ncbi:exopolyphosphatase [Rhodococcus sp. EPR-157]|uniref:acyclic terpene utilization AtuA family protein n=1 Tax=Rhodococcus sp. EPR-157 TaxID=1813677 RepID=UPI0007BC0A50|nr:acyclic terpene utilization AtuA family protein [Rhodococcus sp. EPR-157]KZF13179.1 exopolyphosphatase [Rhodococcus sp. EPR-157]
MSELRPLRIANCSGFFGDRLAAAREIVDGGPVDVLTGDWLAELTMGVLVKQRKRSPEAGFARTFVRQLEGVLATCLDRHIKIVSNAGGLNPHACAEEITRIAENAGRTVRVAVVDGDDATDAFALARRSGWDAPHLDTGQSFADIDREPDVVSAYLGAWGIKEALDAGADVVVTGRVTDAAIIIGPAAWHFGWSRTDWDALAGAVTAGHVIECGAQATGGNFSFFSELDGMAHVGFPIAEIAADGSCVITKHPGTGGAVTVETVTAQLLYEIDGPRYANPDVITRLDTARLTQLDTDRVQISGVRGEAAPATIKVGALVSGGWRNEVTFVLTGANIEAKAELAQRAMWANIVGGEKAFEMVTVRLLRADKSDPASMNEAVALLTISVTDASPDKVRAFPRAAIETGLASYPGLYFTGPPAAGSEVTVFWPTLMPADAFHQRVTLGDKQFEVAPAPTTPPAEPIEAPLVGEQVTEFGPTVRQPLGTVVGARSGDKAGNATLGLWARDDREHDWLRSWWTEDSIRALIPEAAECSLRMWELPHLRACGVTIVGLLGRGVAANLNLDSQGKGLGEFVRARHHDIPAAFIDNPPSAPHSAPSEDKQASR